MAEAKAVLRHTGKDLQLVQVLAKPGMAFLKRPELELGQIFNHRLDHGGDPPRSGIVQELHLSSDQRTVQSLVKLTQVSRRNLIVLT